MKKRCKECEFWITDDQAPKLIPLEKGRDKVLFGNCRNPLIDGVQNKYHSKETMMVVQSKAKYPVFTHAKFGCSLMKPKQ